MIRDLTLLRLHYIIRNMRKQDWVEVSNLVPRAYCEPDMLAMLTMQATRLGFIVESFGVPAVLVQACERHSGNWSVGMFATEDFENCWRETFKHIRAVLIPAIIEAGGRYCEAHVHAGNIEAQRFLKRLGFRPRSDVLEGYGAFGEPFILFAVTIGDLPHVLHEIPRRSEA